MARRLSKKKISGWLLLIAVIIFFKCDGYQKTTKFLMSFLAEREQTAAQEQAPPELDVDERLAQRIDSFIERTPYGGTLGLYVWDETAHKPVFAFNPDTLLRPASNMKLLTCITALRRLGPNYSFESGVYVNGVVKDGTLEGDIAFKFTFDPYLTSDSVANLATAVAAWGVERVKGRIIVDLAMREQMQHEEHWTVGDLKLRKIGMIFRGEKRMVQEVKYALSVQGIGFADSQVEVGKLPKEAKLIAKTSTLMRHSIFRALQNSSNEHAECLGFALAPGFLQGIDWPTSDDYRTAATRALTRFVEKELGENPAEVCQLHDTSGLCVFDLLSPRFLVRLLRYAHSHEYIYNELRRCLPVSGMTGTLHDRMWRPQIRGKLQAKTGTLTREDGITSLAGFTRGANGHLLFFSIIQNGYPVYDARRWQDRFCEQLVK